MKKLLLFGAITLSMNVFSQVPSFVPMNGLVAWWPFSGDAADSSGNLNDGTVINATLAPDRNSVANAAYSFNGTDSYIDIASESNFDLTDEMAFSFWINPSSNMSGASKRIIDKSTVNQPDGYLINYNPLNDEFQGMFNLGTANGNSTMTTDTWQFCVVNRTNDSTHFYINAVKLKSGSNIGSVPTNDHSLRIGASHPLDNTVYFEGEIDDVGVWNRALNECEIQDLYNSQLNTTVFTVTQTGPQLTADESGAAYQWLDCDNNYAVINGETNQSYTPAVTGNYAVEISNGACVDTSACFLVDYTGIDELSHGEKELVKVVDLMGRETTPQKNKVLIYQYSDGTTERVFEFE